MTIHPFQTARYNATPRLAHLDDGQAKPAPQFDSLDAMIEAMQKDAKAIAKRTGSKPTRIDTDLCNHRLADLVEQNPGITTAQMAERLGHKPGLIHARMDTLIKWGCVRVEYAEGATKPVRTYYRVPGAPVEAQDTGRETVRTRMRDYIRDNPGCTTHDIAAFLGRSKSNAASIIADHREALGIASKREHHSKPARHWIGEAPE